MENSQPYFCKCENCKRELWDMINEPPISHLLLEMTMKQDGQEICSYIREHKRFCDILCLQEWVNKSMPIKTS